MHVCFHCCTETVPDHNFNIFFKTKKPSRRLFFFEMQSLLWLTVHTTTVDSYAVQSSEQHNPHYKPACPVFIYNLLYSFLPKAAENNHTLLLYLHMFICKYFWSQWKCVLTCKCSKAPGDALSLVKVSVKTERRTSIGRVLVIKCTEVIEKVF